MTNDVVLSAALRNNLLSLQNTQKNIDTTQNRLATGKKVNSALDNPQSYFAAQALTNRANDLSNLLDSIGQSIQVIQAANNGITALTTLVNQAQSIGQSAQTAVASASQVASATGDKNLSGIEDLTTLSGLDVANETYTLNFTVTDSTGKGVDTANDINNNNNLAGTTSIQISANDSIDDLINKINSIQLSNGASTPAATGGQALTASLDSNGNLQIKANNGYNYTLEFKDTSNDDDSHNLGIASALGFSSVVGLDNDGSGNPTHNVEFTATASATINSSALYVTDGSGNTSLASASTRLDQLTDSTGTTSIVTLGGNHNTDFLTVAINGGTAEDIHLEDSVGANQSNSIQDVIDSINSNSSLNTKIAASFDASTGKISIQALDGSVTSVTLGTTDGNTLDLGFSGVDLNGGSGDVSSTIHLGAAAGQLAQYQSDYNTVLDQIDQLVKDTGYAGTNLLNGDDLNTFFNETRTSSLTTKGATLNAGGLGLSRANFSDAASVNDTLSQVNGALTNLRSFGSSLAASLGVIQARQDFTTNLINTLQTGSDNLTLADQNEEGAKLLALQTRQSLGITSLSLASQSQQAILRLF